MLRLAKGAALGLTGLLPGCGGDGRLPAAADLLDPGRAPTGPLDQPVVVPKVNGAVNVHPLRCLGCPASDPMLDPALVALQLRAVYELGFDGIRVTAPLGDRASLLAAVPYARAARALGIDALVLLADFSGFTTARALHDSGRRVTILKLYASLFAGRQEPLAPAAQLGGLGPQGTGRVAFQVLNEPVGFVGLPPSDYVREVLRPCFQDLRTIDDGIIVVAAAEAGNGHGPPRVRAMLEAGLESACDRVAYHVYQTEIVNELPGDLRRVIWITESGAFGTARHLAWVREVFPAIVTRLRDATRIFFFDLFDEHRGGYRVLDIAAGPSGYTAVVESAALHDYWSARVRESAGGRPLVPFETLVPDVRRYFPSAAEIEAVETAPF